MQINFSNTYTPNFQANLKLTPFVKETISGLSTKHQERFIETQRTLNALENDSELMLSRRCLPNGKIIPVITNLKTGAMIADLNNPIKKFGSATIELLERIALGKKAFERRIFSNNGRVIEESIQDIQKNTFPLPSHPLTQSNLLKIELSDDLQLTMSKLEKRFPDKELIFSLKDEQKLFIQQYDEGYIYYITDAKNIPNGEYFTVNYAQNGFKVNYDSSRIAKDKVTKIFERYTSKALEKLNK